MIAFLRNFIFGAIALAGAVFIFSAANEGRKQDPAWLPDHDFLPEIDRFMAQERFKEAELLCCDVIGMGLPGSGKAGMKLRQCRRESRRWSNNAADVIKGFITGNGVNGASVSGAIASDLFLYGDLRDLGIQGWRKLTGLPVDAMIVLLSGVGAVSEFAGMLNVPPALLKYFYRTGKFSAGIADQVRSVLLKMTKSGKVTAADKKLFFNLNTVFRRHGMQRAGVIMKGVKNPAELEALAKFPKKAPEVPYLIALAEPEQSGRLLLRFSADDAGLRFLKSAARKGKSGTELLKKIRIVKFTIKNFYQGRFYDMMTYAAAAHPQLRKYFFAGAAFLALAGLFFWMRLFIFAGKFLRRRKAACSISGDGEKSLPGDNVPDSNNSECSD